MKYGSDREYDRIKAWHATFNAALTGGAVYFCQAGVRLESLVRKAREIADCAHGPLEATKT